MTSVYNIVMWVKRSGGVKSIDRLRVKLLPRAMKEGIYFSKVTPSTSCSPEFLVALKATASAVVGKPCP